MGGPAARACERAPDRWLLEHLPPRLHLVIASRTDPPLPLAQLRARGQLAELRGADLRFQGAEAHDLLRYAAGSEVTAAETEALEARTEGWAAGVQLAGMALRDRHDREAFIAAFTGSHRYLADYLTCEVLDRLPMNVRSFVMQTAILDRMCAPLCDAVVEIGAQAFIAQGGPPTQPNAHPAEPDAQRMLQELEHMQLFVVPLDDERRWYRYHHVFAEVVRAQLQQAFGAVAVARLHQRASDWYDRANLVDDALGHALAAGASGRAAALVERRAAELIESGVLLPLWHWLGRLPNGAVHTRPALALARAMVAIAAGDLERAGALLSHVDQAHGDEGATLEATQPASWLGYTAATGQLLHASLARARGEAERARMLVGRALAALPSSQPFLQAWALWEQGSAELLAADTQSARRSFEMLLGDGLPCYGGLAIQAAIGLARIATLQGRLREATQLYQRAIGAAQAEESSASRAVGLLHAGLASVHYERNELGAAEQQAQAALALGGDPPSALLTAVANVTLARIKRAQGEVAPATQALARAQEVLPALQSPFFRDLLAGYGYGQLCLELGDIPAVTALVGDATVNAETRRYLKSAAPSTSPRPPSTTSPSPLRSSRPASRSST